ncbi:CHRD domain-containing protein [Nocardioides sp.]|uniref:CHRD domain-containing protein n=1 Tax=Nocardioides sp. TaxID=35761 RepID=UPI00262675A5|nr:CHRD domain-containing protein [Nocardioides sp.]
MNATRKTLAGLGAAALAASIALPVTSAFAGHENTVAKASLNGKNEVDDMSDRRIVGDRNGRGSAVVFGIDGDPNTLCYSLLVKKIGPAAAAHIHEGGPDENGPVVANLAAPADGTAGDCLTDGEEGKFPVGDDGEPLATVAEILANPEDYYVNVHNEQFPGGAIRGQLAKQ